MTHVSWPEINAFHQIRKTLVKWPELLGGRNTVRYRGKVKIHGTNAAVQVKHGNNCIAQSRERIIGTGNDNCGFAAWVESMKDKWLATNVPDALVFGEWCGPGIMKGTAINKIPNKVFAVFAVQPFDDLTKLIVEPVEITPYIVGVPDTYVIPWYGAEDIEIPWLDQPEVLEPIAARINEHVKIVEACDPWIKAQFDQEGIGEGIVFYPVSHPGRKHFGDLAFKAKGEEHKIVAKAKPAQLDPSIAAGAKEFAKMVCTPARLEQGARAVCDGELKFDAKLIGPFLAWVNRDIAKECEAELDASKLDRKITNREVQAYARNWYLTESRKL
jgi:hypothetical protein